MRTAILIGILLYFYVILFHINSLSCGEGSLLLAMPLTYFIWITIFEKSIINRQLQINAYLLQNGWFYWLFSRRTGIFIISIFQAAILTIGLIIGWNSLVSSLWAVWLADAMLIIYIMKWLECRLESQLKPEFRSLISREWSLRLNLMVMTPIWIMIEFMRPHTDYRYLSLQEALTQLLIFTQTTPSCEPLGIVMRLILLKETALWWIAQQTLPELESFWLKVMGWVVVVGSVGVMIWAFSRLILGIYRLVWRIIPYPKIT